MLNLFLYTIPITLCSLCPREMVYGKSSLYIIVGYIIFPYCLDFSGVLMEESDVTESTNRQR